MYLNRPRRFVPVFLVWLLSNLWLISDVWLIRSVGRFVPSNPDLELGLHWTVWLLAGITAYDAWRLTGHYRAADTEAGTAMKSPRAAALLNIIPLGLGYIYLGRPKRTIATVLIAVAAVFGLLVGFGVGFGCALDSGCGPAVGWAVAVAGAALLLLLVVLVMFTVVDAWRLARHHGEGRLRYRQRVYDSVQFPTD